MVNAMGRIDYYRCIGIEHVYLHRGNVWVKAARLSMRGNKKLLIGYVIFSILSGGRASLPVESGDDTRPNKSCRSGNGGKAGKVKYVRI